jgi:hypothetical protein
MELTVTYVNFGAFFVTSAATLLSLPFFLSFFDAATVRQYVLSNRRAANI